MADKTKNCGKGQLTSTDAKELYEAFMRNYEETMGKLENRLTLVLKRHFKTVHRQLFPTRRSILMKMQHMRIMMWVNLSQSTEWRKSVLSSMSVSSWQMQVLPQDMADMLASARTFMSV